MAKSPRIRRERHEELLDDLCRTCRWPPIWRDVSLAIGPHAWAQALSAAFADDLPVEHVNPFLDRGAWILNHVRDSLTDSQIIRLASILLLVRENTKGIIDPTIDSVLAEIDCSWPTLTRRSVTCVESDTHLGVHAEVPRHVGIPLHPTIDVSLAKSGEDVEVALTLLEDLRGAPYSSLLKLRPRLISSNHLGAAEELKKRREDILEFMRTAYLISNLDRLPFHFQFAGVTGQSTAYWRPINTYYKEAPSRFATLADELRAVEASLEGAQNGQERSAHPASLLQQLCRALESHTEAPSEEINQ